MAGEIEEPFRLNFQADLLHSGSISFGRFESESLSWERRSIFSHNRYLEEVEKYSKPGTVTEKKAYFEAEFKRKALLKQRSSECQDGGESPTDGNNDLRNFEEYGNCSESPCSSVPSKCNTETGIQHHEKGDVAWFDESTPDLGNGEDIKSQHCESQNYDFHPVTTQDELGETHQRENEDTQSQQRGSQSYEFHLVTTQDELGETHQRENGDTQSQQRGRQSYELHPVTTQDELGKTHQSENRDTQSQQCESQSYEFHPVTTQDELGGTHQSENENVTGNTEQSIGLTLIDHIVPVDVSSEANDDSSLACQISEKDHGSISPAPHTAFSPKVNPATKKKVTRSTLNTQVNVDWSPKQVLNGASKGSMRPRTSEGRGLLVKKTEKKLTRPASPLIGSGVKALKPEVLRSEKAVNVKAQFPLSEKTLHGVRPVVNRLVPRSKQTVNPSKTHLIQSATCFSFKTDQRAENRNEFYTKVSVKMHAKEVEIKQIKAKSLEKQASETKQFRKSLDFKAKPLPSFYNVSSRGSVQHKVTHVNETSNQPRPRSSQAMAARNDKNQFKSSIPSNIRPSSSQAMATRHDKNTFKSSVPSNIRPSSSQAMTTRHDKNPLNIRPSSSTSSTNRLRLSESVGRSRVPERKDKERGKETKLDKPLPSPQAMATRHDRNPLNIRPSSSTSSTNRLRVSESVGRNRVPERKDKEKGKDTKLNKQKDPEPRARDMLKRHVKGIHTWNGPKVGVVS